VFLPFAWRAPNPKSPAVSHFYDPVTGGRWITDNQRSKWDGDDPHAEAFGSAAAIGRFRESIRLTYVALTRAERRCYIFWGNAERQGVLPPPLAWLLDPSKVLPDDPKNLNKRKPLRADPATIIDRWQQIAENTPGCTVLSMNGLQDRHALAANADLPVADQRADQRVVPAPDRLARFDRVIEPSWSSRSFTSLSRDVEDDLNRPDHDQLSEPGLLLRDAGAAEDAELLPIAARFPRGANPGTCLHDILEVADFRKPVDAPRVARTLKRYAIEQDANEVATWMNQVLATTLTGSAGHAEEGSPQSPFSLNQLSWEDTIRELPYTLAVSKLRPERISSILARQYAVPTLTQSAWSGFLNGFIDLLVRRDGQYWIIDWKSNWLGEKIADYADDGLQSAMTEHAYNLQMSLYTVAVHRMLRHRLAGYNYQSHFGGVHYLFLRGMTGGNNSSGVYSSRLDETLLLELDAALDGADEQ
jgi:exodeoxyribonuclease V beta subunit